MWKHIRSNLFLVSSTILIASVIYPLVLLAVAQGIVPSIANGSLVQMPDGQIVGSRLIAQEFKGDEWFHPRPSAVGYNAGGSGGSNMGANNPKLRERVEEQLKGMTGGITQPIPSDAVTTSGSGLDPHITLRYAKLQVERVARARTNNVSKLATTRDALNKILQDLAFKPLAGIVGSEELVNVLEVNLAVASLK